MGIYYNFSGFKSKKHLDRNEISVATESKVLCRKLSEFSNIEYRNIDRMLSVALGFILTQSNKRNKVYVGYNYDLVRDKKNYVDAQQSFISDKEADNYKSVYVNAMFNNDGGDIYIVCTDTKEYINYSKYFRAFFGKTRALDILGFIFNQDVFNKRDSDEKLANWYRKAVYATTDISDLGDGYTDVTADFE